MKQECKPTLVELLVRLELMQHRGLHDEALIAAAVHYKQDDLAAAFRSYLDDRCRLGYMAPGSLMRRNADRVRLLDSIKQVHSEATFDVFRRVL